MPAKVKNGTIRRFKGVERIHFDGYWIRYYPPPRDTLAARKAVIDSMTRRAFHHTERGINTPGEKLELARRQFEIETDPTRKRVNGAMLAGALFNRASDILTSIVELEEKGVKIDRHNPLLKETGRCFKEALELGHYVKHYSGHEGIDELWGEPFKSFVMPLELVFESRYIKLSAALRDIDLIARVLTDTLCPHPAFQGLETKIKTLVKAAKAEIEIMRSDPDIFLVWPAFVSAAEGLEELKPHVPAGLSEKQFELISDGLELLQSGRNLIVYLTDARVPMPKSTQSLIDQCATFKLKLERDNSARVSSVSKA